MTSPEQKRQLAALRSEWRMWRRARHPHRDFNMICPTRCGLPECEACSATAYRGDRLAEVEARAATLGRSA